MLNSTKYRSKFFTSFLFVGRLTPYQQKRKNILRNLFFPIFVIISFLNCNHKKVLESKKYFFIDNVKNLSFYREVFKDEKVPDSMLAELNIKRELLGLQKLENGVEGFEFGFCFFQRDTISYYLVFGEKKNSYYGKLYKLSHSILRDYKGQKPVDSFEVNPRSGWINFYNQLYELKADKIKNECDSSLPNITRNFADVSTSVNVEYANFNTYRLYSWTRVLLNLKDDENILFDKVIKLLFWEFKLSKKMPSFWLNVEEVSRERRNLKKNG